jgi:hypothetical protein
LLSARLGRQHRNKRVVGEKINGGWWSGAHLPSAAFGHNIFGIFGVRLHLNLVRAAGAAHPKDPNSCAMIHPNLLLLGVEAHPLANEVLAALTPDIEWHLKADDEDPLVQFFCPFSERMLPSKLQHKKLAKATPVDGALYSSQQAAVRENFATYALEVSVHPSEELRLSGRSLISYLIKTAMLLGIIVRWEVVPEEEHELSVKRKIGHI